MHCISKRHWKEEVCVCVVGILEQIHDLGRLDKHARNLAASLARLREVFDTVDLAIGPLQVFGGDLLWLVELQSNIVALAQLRHGPKVKYRPGRLLTVGERDDAADAAVERRAKGRLGGA